MGWYRFEPTPGRIDPVTGLGAAVGPWVGRDHHDRDTDHDVGLDHPDDGVGHADFGSALGDPDRCRRRRSSVDVAHTRAHVFTVCPRRDRQSCVFALLSFVAFLAYAAWLRTRRRRHDPDDRRRVLGAWTEALERLAAAGIERRPSTTSLEFALRQAPALGAGAAGPPLMDLARLHTAAMYSPDRRRRTTPTRRGREVDAIADALRATRAADAAAAGPVVVGRCGRTASVDDGADDADRPGDAADDAQPRAVRPLDERGAFDD